MDFFGIGTGELVVIFLLAILFLGPQRLVVFARDLGRWIRQARLYVAKINTESPSEIQEVRAAIAELRAASDDLRAQLQQQIMTGPLDPRPVPPRNTVPPGIAGYSVVPPPPARPATDNPYSIPEQFVLPSPPPPGPEETSGDAAAGAPGAAPGGAPGAAPGGAPGAASVEPEAGP